MDLNVVIVSDAMDQAKLPAIWALSAAPQDIRTIPWRIVAHASVLPPLPPRCVFARCVFARPWRVACVAAMVLDIEIGFFGELTSEGEELWWKGWAHATLQLDWPAFYSQGFADHRTITVYLTTVGAEAGMVQMWIPCPPWVDALGPTVPNWCFGPMRHGPLATGNAVKTVRRDQCESTASAWTRRSL